MKTDKHEKILAAALSLFQRTHDVKSVSLEAIAREAGVSPTTIYNQFGTREALVAEVAKALLGEILKMGRSFIKSDLPFPRKLTEIIAGKLDITSQVHGEILTKMVSQDKTMTAFVAEAYRTEIKPLWREMLADGKRQGYIDPTLDDEALIAYFDIIRTGYSARSELLENLSQNMGLLEQLTRIMCYGFLKKEIDLFNKEA
ncbi:MAG: TetR/AcrR family transcriptional regulator [Dehalococcoidia bacterium]|nr:MAG: TetR/AcrR family transcriptional regulator [Dehalococcoidia bacterium]